MVSVLDCLLSSWQKNPCQILHIEISKLHTTQSAKKKATVTGLLLFSLLDFEIGWLDGFGMVFVGLNDGWLDFGILCWPRSCPRMPSRFHKPKESRAALDSRPLSLYKHSVSSMTGRQSPPNAGSPHVTTLPSLQSAMKA